MIVFTGTVGFKSKRIRRLVLSDFKEIKTIKKLTIETNEELMIAKEITQLVKPK